MGPTTRPNAARAWPMPFAIPQTAGCRSHVQCEDLQHLLSMYNDWLTNAELLIRIVLMVMFVTLCVCVVCVCVVHVCVCACCVCVFVYVCVCEREREIWEDLVSYIVKSTEVQTSPMLASRAQLLACGIHTLVALNATKYVIITEVSAFLQTFRGNLPLHLNFPQNRQLRT